MDRSYPSNTYTVETDFETLDTISSLAYRRVATRILLTRPGVTEAMTVDPKDLESALLNDAAAA